MDTGSFISLVWPRKLPRSEKLRPPAWAGAKLSVATVTGEWAQMRVNKSLKVTVAASIQDP